MAGGAQSFPLRGEGRLAFLHTLDPEQGHAKVGSGRRCVTPGGARSMSVSQLPEFPWSCLRFCPSWAWFLGLFFDAASFFPILLMNSRMAWIFQIVWCC